MKLPKCLCGIKIGFNHDLDCNSCGCLPFHHSSDEESSTDSEAEEARRKFEEFEERKRKINEEEDRKIEEERQRRYHEVLQIIEDAEYRQNLNEERTERYINFHDEKRKMKKRVLKTKSEMDKKARRRLKRFGFAPVKYELEVYQHYKSKWNYEVNKVASSLDSIFLDSRYAANQLLNADVSLEELNIETYEEFLKFQEQLAEEQRRTDAAIRRYTV